MMILSIMGAIIIFILALIAFYLSLRSNFHHLSKNQELDRKNSYMSLSGMIDPLKESLQKIDRQVEELERTRIGAYVGLKDQVEHLFKSQTELTRETKKLSKVMTAPAIGGRWGEMQLKRVVELSGLSRHCNFLEQSTIKDAFEIKRPDLIITLPNNRCIAVDAKTSFESEVNSEEDLESIAKKRAVAVRRHIQDLKKKAYFKLLPASPEFVVMFLPTEGMLAEALSGDPSLIDFAAQSQVILATPTSLIAMLKAISFSFREDSLSQNAMEVKKLAKQLVDRSDKVLEHFEKLGKSLRASMDCYEQTLSTFDGRVLSTAKKLATLESETKGEAKEFDELPQN